MRPPETREALMAARRDALESLLEQSQSSVTRRRFLELLGASLALAGAASCAAPRTQIVPYVRPPEEAVPGKSLYFASVHVVDGFAQGVLVQTSLGRPTKIEGNPLHPDSLGATDAFGQASVLTLYDPNRSPTVLHNGNISTWTEFLNDLRSRLPTLASSGGDGLRFLSESVTSPTLSAQFRQLQQRFPNARWHRWQPVSRDNALGGAMLAFGQPVEPRYHFDAADVVLSLDADPFAWSPGRLRYMHDFAVRRRPERGPLSRVYAVESTPTWLGSAADHRLPLASRAIEPLAFALASALDAETGAAAVPPPTSVPDQWFDAVVADLRSRGQAALVIPGAFQPPSVHALAHSINAALGSVGITIDYSDPVETDPVDHVQSLRQLVDDMATGRVSTLIVLESNPAYTAPADVSFAAAMRNVATRIHLGLFEDETAALCDWHIPALHALETWTDARAFDGTASIGQPTIVPLYDAHSPHEMLAALSDQPTAPAHDIVKNYWQSQYTGADFESFWTTSLRDGVVAGSALPQKNVQVRAGWAAGTTPAASDIRAIELVFRPDPSLYDGRFAANAWLLELPRPLTTLTWDNVAMLSPSTAARLGISNEDVVELRYAGRSVRAPVWVMPGQADDSVSVTLGYARQRGAGPGQGVGFNAYAVRTGDAPWIGADVEIVRTGQTYKLASTQHNYQMQRRDLVIDASEVNAAVQQPVESLYPAYQYPQNRWGMVIDLNSCVGCNACVVACQAENNIPVVGKDQVSRGRDMLWLRVDNYFEGPEENPRISRQIVPCMQCENAPCELVCPVEATAHSTEGLNDMTYNRCVGTRYCSNNCPYKVRHFNFYQYSDYDTPTLKLLRNPDVTVRTRGVMEKCTYCVQRITGARIQAEKENRSIRDGEVVTACQAACPTGSIIFGNLNDPASQVAAQRGLARNYTLLADLNTRPRTTYLAKAPNMNPVLGEA